jgi:hypothetical protein
MFDLLVFLFLEKWQNSRAQREFALNFAESEPKARISNLNTFRSPSNATVQPW